MSTVLFTALALVAFAANSLLCRMALGGELIDPVSFTTLRLASGAVVLLILSRVVRQPNDAPKNTGASWVSAMALFAYAMAFSLAYVSLKTGMGALILFGSVQITMIGSAVISGEKLGVRQLVGSAAAISGLIYLVLPALSAPDPLGASLMCVSGIAWGVYSIRGKGSPSPALTTTGNFVRAAPMAILASLIAITSAHVDPKGVLLASISGIVTSGLGYIVWYKALRGLTTTQASVLQLTVPVLAAAAGIVFLMEELSPRLLFASTTILGGVALAVVSKTRMIKNKI